MSSQLAAQLRILAGAGGANSGAAADRRSTPASSSSIAAAIHGATPGSTASKYRASFLFRSDVAAATDSSTIHSMGVSGMEQLVRLEPRLRSSQSALFQAHSFDRGALTQQQLMQLQTQINHCIRLMAPYFMIKPTHKVLEFLIRRYHVHIYNISALLAAFLPYHDSPLFARLTQTLQFKLRSTEQSNDSINHTKLFGFLEASQREGSSSVTRHTLVERCLHDHSFLQWVMDLVSQKNAATVSNTTITFFTALISEVMARVRMQNNANNAEQTERIVHLILMHSVEVLNSYAQSIMQSNADQNGKALTTPAVTPNRELLYSTLVILTQLSAMHAFNATLLDSIIFLLCKSMPSPKQDQTLMQPLILTLLALAQHQNVKSVVPKAMESLFAATGEPFAVASFVRTLLGISAQYDLNPLLTLLLPPIASYHSNEKVSHSILLELVAGVEGGNAFPLTNGQVALLIRSLFDSYVGQHIAAEKKDWNPKEVSSLRTLVSAIQERYSVALEKIVQDLIQESTAHQAEEEKEDEEEHDSSKSKKHRKAKAESNPLLSLIHLLFEGSSQAILDLKSLSHLNGDSSAPSAGSILTCLNSPLTHIRIQAIQALEELSAKQAATISAPLRAAILRRLRDSESSVLRSLLKVKSLVHLLPHSDLFEAVIQILQRTGHTVEATVLNHHSNHKIVESVFKLVKKMIEQTLHHDSNLTIDAQSAQVFDILHAISPFLFEFALFRPNIPSRLTISVHALLQYIGSKAQHEISHHTNSDEDSKNGFHVCALFNNVSTVKLDDDIQESGAMNAYNQQLMATLVNSYVRLVTNHPVIARCVEHELISVLQRTASTIASFSQSSNSVAGVTSASSPSTGYVVVQLLTQVLEQLSVSPASSSKKTSGDAAQGTFFRLMSHMQTQLGNAWTNFTPAQRKASGKQVSNISSPAAFISATSKVFEPATYSSFLRATFASFIQLLQQVGASHPSLIQSNQSDDYPRALRDLFTFFLADTDSADAFSWHVAFFCKLHLNGGQLQQTSQFLVPILENGSIDTSITLHVIVRAYHLLHALLQNHVSSKAKTSKEQQTVLQQLVPSFILGLASPARAVRHAVIMAAQALNSALDGTAITHRNSIVVNGSSLKLLLTLLSQEKEEFLAARQSNVSENLSQGLKETSTDASLIYMQQFLVKALTSSNSTLSGDASIGVHQLLMSHALELSESTLAVDLSASLRLLQLLAKLPTARTAALTLQALTALLKEKHSQLTSSHVDIGRELIRHLTAQVFSTDLKHSFSIFLQLLTINPSQDTMEDENDEASSSASSSVFARYASNLRRSTLLQLNASIFALLNDQQQLELFNALFSIIKSTEGVSETIADLSFHSSVFIHRLDVGKKKLEAQMRQLADIQAVLELLQLKDPIRTLVAPSSLIAPLFHLLEQLHGVSAAIRSEKVSTSEEQAIEYAKQLTMAVLVRFLSQPELVEDTASSKKGKKGSGFSVSDINVNAVVACLDTSSTEQQKSKKASTDNSELRTLNVALENTRTHALQLLSIIGHSHPELIVDVLIPIFQKLLQQSNQTTTDEEEGVSAPENAITSAMDANASTVAGTLSDAEPYAFTLLNQLISTVLPSIIQAKLDWNVWQLLSVFVDSLGSIKKSSTAVASITAGSKKKSEADSTVVTVATRRRLKLFHNLLVSLNAGSEESDAGLQGAMASGQSGNYLHVVLCLLIVKSANDKASKVASPLSYKNFAHLLSEQFSTEPNFQIIAFNHLLQLLNWEIQSEHAEILAAIAKHEGPQLSISNTKSHKSKKSSEDNGVSFLARILRSPAQISAWQRGVISFLSAHLSRLSFAQQIYRYGVRKQQEIEEAGGDSESQDPHAAIQSSFLVLFEQLFGRLRQSLLLSKHLGSESSPASATLSNHFFVLSTKTNQALLHLNGLLTMENFIRILKELFRLSRHGVEKSKDDRRDYQLILQALSLLHSKLISYKDRQKVKSFGAKRVNDEDESVDGDGDAAMSAETFDPEIAEQRHYYRTRKLEQKLLVSLLPPMVELLTIPLVDSTANSSTENQEIASVKQSTLLNLEMLTSSFAGIKQFQADFVKIVPTVLQLTLLPAEPSAVHAVITSSTWQHISTSALLCLSTVLSSFQEKANVLLLEHIPILLPNTLAILKHLNEAPKVTKPAVTDDAKKIAGKKRKHEDEGEEDESSSATALLTLSNLSSPLLQLSALSVLQASIVSVPDFLTPYLPELLKVLLFPAYHNNAAKLNAQTSAIALTAAAASGASLSSVAAAASAVSAGSSTVDHSSISNVVSQSLTSLIALIPSRTLLPVLFQHYKVAASQGYSSLRRLFDLLGLVIIEFKADNVKLHFKVIFKFFLAAAQQLRKNTTSGKEMVDAYGVSLNDAEDALINSFLELTLKLNETSFKGLFLKMLQWVGPIPNTTAALEGGESVSANPTQDFLARSLVLFKLIEKFSSKLKGIFVTYFGYILDHCVVFLSEPKRKGQAKQLAVEDEDMQDSEREEEEDEDEDEDRPSKKLRKNEDSATATAAAHSNVNKSVLNAGIAGGVSSDLIDLVLTSLKNCLVHDDHHFMDKYHFQLLTNPMVQQLQYAFQTRANSNKRPSSDAHGNQLYDDFITHVLTPTIVQMAVRMGNYLQWKPLVSSLLIHGRSSSAPVRRAAVYVFEQLFHAIGDNFLTVTPELLPWIAEMLEDGDVGVEANVHKLVKIIEKLSGESLQDSLMG